MLEVLAEMEALRTVQDARISKLENDFYLGPWLATFWQLLTGLLIWTLLLQGLRCRLFLGTEQNWPTLPHRL